MTSDRLGLLFVSAAVAVCTLVSRILIAQSVDTTMQESSTTIRISATDIARRQEYDSKMEEARRLSSEKPVKPGSLARAELLLRWAVKYREDREESLFWELPPLANVLAEQRKWKESLEEWRKFVKIGVDWDGVGQDGEIENLLSYVQVAFQAKAPWPEIVRVYNCAVWKLNTRRKLSLLFPNFNAELERRNDLRLMTHVAVLCGYAYWSNGPHDNEVIAREFEAAKRLSPTNPLLHLYYGRALEYHRDGAGAKRAYTFVLENALDPAHRVRARELLNRLRR